MAQSKYPSSKDLQAFRHRIAVRSGAFVSSGNIITAKDGPMHPYATHDASPSPTGGAWPYERREGIGGTPESQDFGQDPASWSLALWGANDARRQAFWSRGAFSLSALQTFAPGWLIPVDAIALAKGDAS